MFGDILYTYNYVKYSGYFINTVKRFYAFLYICIYLRRIAVLHFKKVKQKIL